MGLMVQVIVLMLKICGFATLLVLQGSAGNAISPSPVTFDAISPIGEGTPGSVPRWKQLRGNAPSPASPPNGSSFHPPLVLPPLMSAPIPKTTKGLTPLLSPSTPTLLPPNNSAAPPIQGIVPSLPPSASHGKPPHMEDPGLEPEAPVPEYPPAIHPVMPGSMPPSPRQSKAPDNKSPLFTPITPLQIAPPPREILQKPPTSQPIVHEVPPTNFPVPAASPPHNLLRHPPPIHPTVPEVPPSNLPVPAASPSHNLLRHPPPIHPTVPEVPPSNLPVPATSPPPSNFPRYSPPMHPLVPEVPPSNLPEPDVSPISTPPPSFNWKRDGMPVVAPSNGMPKGLSPRAHSPAEAPIQNSPRASANAPPPASAIKSPRHAVLHPPTPLPSTPFYKHHHARKNIPSPAPSSYLVPPPASTDKGPFIPTPPSYPPKLDPKSKPKHHAPQILNPVPPSYSPFSSPESPLSPASPAQATPSQQTKMPFLSPKISPSGSSPRNPKMPHLPHIQALPPPPPNEDCTSFSCSEPFTNTPPGSPCGCVLPMQVGLRLSVALYTFFPLVSELAAEIAVGVFMKQSQVRIMGANAASQDPEKTIVLIDLVPLGEMFDNTTAYLAYQRFWHKQVAINTNFFGDHEVLYVRYPGLPSSPPSAPSSIDNDLSSGHDNSGNLGKPLGVDVRGQQHKKGLKGSVIAIIVLSASIAVILCCAVAWVLLFRHTDRNSQPEQTPPTNLPSLAKSSGITASVIGSGPNSVSLSYNSSIAPYTGTAKTYNSSDIEKATDNFDASSILGEGGFGLVYSGVLEDGTKVAVKVLKRDDQQGGREFLAEVEMLSRLHHRNLVRLIGICTEERARCLVYELIPNGSVESHLHGVDKEDAPLDWGARLKIALGAARGLAYLHEDSSPRVIHRDFKSSNILLEHDFTPKVSDFGLARTALDEENRHISTRVMGTFGYVAPEYAMTGHLLVKSDVYSYGVVLLELLTGRKPVDMSQPPGQENLVTWARPLLTSKEGLELMTDQSLGPDFPFDSIAKVAAIASMCVQPEVSHRPFMGEVVQALKLVCNECDATRDLGSRSCSQEDLSVDFDARLSTNSGHLPDPLQMQSPLSDYVSALDIERGLPVSELFSASARLGRTDSGSFRRHSSSGPLRSTRVLPLWQRMRRLSGGSLSEHGVMFRSWPGSH